MSTEDQNSKQPSTLAKVYEPAPVEKRWWQAWEDAQVFAPRPDASEREPYCVVIPPPNVTGSLHIGHALNNTLQDILVRYQRMNGKAALWVFGMDHAGIATQNVVERQLDQAGQTRQGLGREAFIKKIWEWKEESGGRIRHQLKRLGASLDYEHEHFTMDEGLSQAVRHVFVSLHEQGLIYRDKRLVNWDCQLRTAISDLEVISKEQKGSLWYFHYPLAEDPKQTITIATTRPETLLGDTAVAVHPDDARYKNFIGKKIKLPLVGREIPIVADEYSDPEKGSGAVKITPAHDFNDFEVGKRHQLEAINILTEDGHLNQNVPEVYQGMERFKAREKIVEDLEALGLVEKIEEHVNAVPYGDRSGTIIEPLLTDQWFVDAEKLAIPALKAVEQGQMCFVPKNWEKTYFEWLRNIQPWCISRQLWWGHRIPAWYGPDGKIFVAKDETEAQKAADEHYGAPTKITQDPDVLDTWFSSALWPFSTLGWPVETAALKHYYPTATLVTSFDIIFFWVARMMMMGLYFTGKAPFKDVYIHALIRDAQGQKMSKSKGNVMDPLELMEKHGTDATRFTLTAFAAQGRDIKLSEDRILGYRNFCNKIWNGARLVLSMALPNADIVALQKNDFSLEKIEAKHPISQWILSELSTCITKTRHAIENYRFNEAAQATYQFFWSVYCDWFLELIKPSQKNSESETDEQAQLRQEFATVAIAVLDQSMRLMHPIIPFLTEEIWQKITKRAELLPQAAYPQGLKRKILNDYSREHELLSATTSVVNKVREIRMQLGVPLNKNIQVIGLYSSNKDLLKNIDKLSHYIMNLGKFLEIGINDLDLENKTKVARGVTNFKDLVVRFDLEGLIPDEDIEKERARQEKELKKIEKALMGNEKTLNNPKFLEKSPPELQAEMRQTVAKYQRRINEIKEGLKEL